MILKSMFTKLLGIQELDPNPSGLWGPNAAFNYTRYESEEKYKID